MGLTEILRRKKKSIVSTWVERTLDTYTSSGFFKRSKDLFANPVGANIRNGLDRLYDLLLEEAPCEELAEPLDLVIRIRAVQDFTPAEAVAPIMEIKWVVRQLLGKKEMAEVAAKELDLFDLSVDRAALTAFDMYMTCRDQLYRVRVNEVKSGRAILADSGCVSSKQKDSEKSAERLVQINPHPVA